MLSIWDCKTQILLIFLQYYYSAILPLELHCSSIVKIYIYIYILSCFSQEFLSPLSSFSLSHLRSPLFRPKHHPSPNINITHHNRGNVGGNVDLGFFFFSPVVIGVDQRCLSFCSGGILVGSGGVVGMVEARWW